MIAVRHSIHMLAVQSVKMRTTVFTLSSSTSEVKILLLLKCKYN